VSATVIPAAELATIVHPGPHTDIDRTYGALAAYVARHELAVDGPIREYYLVGPTESRDESLWRTEVGWPIFQARHPRHLGDEWVSRSIVIRSGGL
jgi:effector-binding domain-containing protein